MRGLGLQNEDFLNVCMCKVLSRLSMFSNFVKRVIVEDVKLGWGVILGWWVLVGLG